MQENVAAQSGLATGILAGTLILTTLLLVDFPVVVPPPIAMLPPAGEPSEITNPLTVILFKGIIGAAGGFTAGELVYNYLKKQAKKKEEKTA